MSSDIKTINIDIRGHVFKTTISTLQSIPGSRLSKLDTAQKTHFFDRDPHLFRHILNAHYDGEVHAPRDVCPSFFRNELSFWGIPLRLVAPCCWRPLYEADNEKETLQVIVEETDKYESNNRIYPFQVSVIKSFFQGASPRKVEDSNDAKRQEKETLTSRLWLFLEEPGSSKASKIWFFIYIFIVVLSVVIYIIWLEPGVRVPAYLGNSDAFSFIRTNASIYSLFVKRYSEHIVLLGTTDPHKVLLLLDTFCIVFFVVETVVHFLVCPHKLRYFLNLHHILKILLCISMVVGTSLEFKKDLLEENSNLGKFYYSCKSLNVLRLFMIFKLHKIYKRLHILMISLKQSVKELVLLLFSFVITVVVFGCLIFSAEIETPAFPNTFYAMWWSVITMTTVGYGDFYPVSWRGYIVGVVCAITGIIVLALPVAAIATTFSSIYSRNADLQKHLNEIKKEEELRLTTNTERDENQIRALDKSIGNHGVLQTEQKEQQ